jgi:tetratricopeptide (TPR) repeat protein
MEQTATGLIVIGWKLAVAVLARFTNVFDAYVGERAKLLAQFHNLDNLVQQTAKLTETTKVIESRVSYDLWDRQMRLTYLRDTYTKLMEALARMGTIQYHLREHQAAYRRSAPLDPLADERLKAAQELGTALADFVRIRDTAFLVLPEDAHEMLQAAISDLRNTHTETWQEDCLFNIALLEKAMKNLRRAARADLGYDPPPAHV